VHKVYEGKGRPKKDASVKQIVWQTSAKVEQKYEAIQHAIEQKSCFMLATNLDKKALTPEENMFHYKAQSSVERGF
jgi:transposase